SNSAGAMPMKPWLAYQSATLRMDWFTPKISCTTTTAPTASSAGVATYASSWCPSSAFSVTQFPMLRPSSRQRECVVVPMVGERRRHLRCVPDESSFRCPSRILRMRFGVAAHLCQPAAEAKDLPALGDEESPEIARADFPGVLSGESFQTPAQIGASPGTQAGAAGGV